MRYGSFRKSTKSFEPPAPTVDRSARIDVAMVSVIELEGQRVSVKVADLSDRGLGGQSAQPLPIGAEAHVTLPRIGAIPVQIRWALGTRFGARFIDQVEVEELFEASAPIPAPAQTAAD